MDIGGTRPTGINVSFLFERKASSIYDHVETLTERIMQNNGITQIIYGDYYYVPGYKTSGFHTMKLLLLLGVCQKFICTLCPKN